MSARVFLRILYKDETSQLSQLIFLTWGEISALQKNNRWYFFRHDIAKEAGCSHLFLLHIALETRLKYLNYIALRRSRWSSVIKIMLHFILSKS